MKNKVNADFYDQFKAIQDELHRAVAFIGGAACFSVARADEVRYFSDEAQAAIVRASGQLDKLARQFK